jgi:ribosomal protein L37AE/L43A
MTDDTTMRTCLSGTCLEPTEHRRDGGQWVCQSCGRREAVGADA